MAHLENSSSITLLTLRDSMISHVATMRQIGFFVCVLLSGIAANPVTNDVNIKICESEQCRVVADILNKSMNKTLNPCDDFYNYACGSWDACYPMPSNQDVWNLEKIVEAEALLETKEILEAEEDSDDIAPLKYEKLYYKSCMDIEKIEEVGIKPLEAILDYTGGWPLIMNLSDWNDEEHRWQDIHEVFARVRDLPALFDIRVFTDDRNISRYALALYKPTDTLLDWVIRGDVDGATLESYVKFVGNVVAVFLETENKSVPEEQIVQDLTDLLNFEIDLHSIKVPSNESDDMEPLRTYITIEDLQKLYDEEGAVNSTAKIDWLCTVQSMFKNVDNITIDETEDIGMRSDERQYLRQLSHLLDKTPNRVIVNYIHWKLIASSVKYANRPLRNLHIYLTTKPEDLQKLPERWEQCIMDMKLGTGYRFEYMKRHLSDETRKMAVDMVKEMRGEMMDEIDHSTWLDEETREDTLLNLHNMKWHIGVTHFLPRREFFDHIYDRMELSDNYLDNVLNARVYWTYRFLRRLRRTRNPRNYIRVDPLKSISVYDRSRNIIVVTAAQLSVPFFHSSLPLPVTYGYMGPTMGQQMSRAMEKEVNTNTFITPWSTYLGDTYKKYETKTGCITGQYFNYTMGPSNTDENIYDNIALKVAYNAYRDSFISESVEKLPGLEEFSDNQLFFLSYAAKYCQTTSPKYLSEINSIFYTPNEYRVIGALSNSEDFAKAFSCPLNSPMNPENKCIL